MITTPRLPESGNAGARCCCHGTRAQGGTPDFKYQNARMHNTDQSPERKRRVWIPRTCPWGLPSGCGITQSHLGPARQAFTLIELAMVVFIMGIIASIAVPRYANFVAQQRVEAAARRIVTDLAFAQRQAKFTSTTVSVDFAVGDDSTYELVGIQDPDHPGDNYVVSLLQEPYLARIISAPFGADSEIVFDGFGIPDTGGSVTVQVGSYQRTVQVDGNSGGLPSGKVLKESEI